MAEPLIDILIPTYNRAADLKKNLEILSGYIGTEISKDIIRIIISDNCSPDETQKVVEEMLDQVEFPIKYVRNNENIGLEKNVVKVLSLASAEYVMFLGDDDYIDTGYLSFVQSEITSGEVGAIIPGLCNLLQNGDEIAGRVEPFETKKMNPSYQSALFASHLGHQMSGLVLKRDNLLSHYLKEEKWRNPYLFIHFLTYCLLRYKTIYAPKFKVKITSFNEKDWGYNNVGLLDEVFKSYYGFDAELNQIEIRDLLLRFSKMHSYRYEIAFWMPLKLFRQWRYLTISTQALPGFQRGLIIQLFKDYLISFVNYFNKNK